MTVADAVVGVAAGDRLVDGQRRALADRDGQRVAAGGALAGGAVTVLATLPPASSSAWVTVWTALQVVLSVGPRLVARQTGGSSLLVSARAEPGQGDVAGVGHHVAVGDDLAGRGDRRRWSRSWRWSGPASWVGR